MQVYLPKVVLIGVHVTNNIGNLELDLDNLDSISQQILLQVMVTIVRLNVTEEEEL